MPARDHNYIASLFAGDGRFSCYVVDDLVLLTGNRTCDLLAFCNPYIVRRGSIEKLYFDLGLVVCNGCDTAESCLIKNIQRGQYLALPITTPIENFPDMIVRDGEPSAWIMNQMFGMIEKYCLTRGEAIAMLSSDDPFVIRLRDANAGRVEDLVINLRRAPGSNST